VTRKGVKEGWLGKGVKIEGLEKGVKKGD